MENIKVYNKDGNLAGEMKAPEFLLASRNAVLIHQVFKAIAANKRIPVAHTKNRSEVSGGGKKPWKQKGTGRARHGSIRSPIWRHGGVTHGPRKDRDFSQKINQKMASSALKEALSGKFSSGQLKVLENLEATSKTKNLAKTFVNLFQGKSALLVVADSNKEAIRAAKNLKNITPVYLKNLNLYDLLNHKYVVFEKAAFNNLNK